MAVVATDLNTGEPVVLTHGNLVDAIRASCAFPGLFEPVKIGPGAWPTADWWLRYQRGRRAIWVRNSSLACPWGSGWGPRIAIQYISGGDARGQPPRKSISWRFGSATPTWCCGPTSNRLPGTLSIEPTRPSKRAPGHPARVAPHPEISGARRSRAAAAWKRICKACSW